MNEITDLPLDLPSVSRKKVTAAFDGGRITSDGGVMLLSAAERQIGIIDRRWRLIPDRRNPCLVTHSVASILKARVFAIACGYEDGNDLGFLRSDPAFKLACGRLPDEGKDLCSQPTLSRWENAPDKRSQIRLTYALKATAIIINPFGEKSVLSAWRKTRNGQTRFGKKRPKPRDEQSHRE